ncbi:MAG: GTP cyclohydrolase I FolE [Planctomycetes bacterium]|nr:GTP cyclohydrolase I FolE [Planctomycetota bacterium]
MDHSFPEVGPKVANGHDKAHAAPLSAHLEYSGKHGEFAGKHGLGRHGVGHPSPLESLPRRRPTREEAEQAIRTLIRWAGDDPDREGLIETPARVARAYEEFFAGYAMDPRQLLEKTFEETGGYHDMVLIRDIALNSHCEHHMVPIVGKVHLAYLPEKRVVGISKLARVVDAFGRRLQIQEKLTVEIAETIQEVLRPRGVAIVIEAAHECMTTRGVKKPDSVTVTRWMTGAFRDSNELRAEFLQLIRG